MRRLTHLILSPNSRLARLMLGEKRLAIDPLTAEDHQAHLPIFIDLDGTVCEGLWAIVDHLEGAYPEIPLLPEDVGARAEALRWLDWALVIFNAQVTQKIVHEKAPQRFTGSSVLRAPDMNIIRQGREILKTALAAIGKAAEKNGNLAARTTTLGDLGVAAHLSTLDYFGEIPWAEYPATSEWYTRMKSRPSFRSLLADRVPGQPPVSYYAELDF